MRAFERGAKRPLWCAAANPIFRGDARPGNRKGGDAGMRVTVPSDYKPSDKEKFMNSVMLEHFRQKLLDWRSELLDESSETLQYLQEGAMLEADIADRASTEADRSLQLRTRDRARKLISKIDEALERIESGTYGYCEETREPISLQRLEARPIATLSLEAQERHEHMEKMHRDD
jgi:DnaK suppressor protein